MKLIFGIISFLLTAAGNINGNDYIQMSAITSTPGLCQQNNITTKDTSEIVFVIDSAGAEIKEHPDFASTTVETCLFGEHFQVVSEQNGWIEITRNGPKSPLGFIRKSSLGNETDIPLTSDDLAKVYVEGDEESLLPGNIELTLIDKNEFDAMKKTVINYFVADTDRIESKHGIVRLPLKKGFKKYKDDPHWAGYSYIGQYPSLNKYVMEVAEYEAEDIYYDFIDKTTGKSSGGFFEAFPVLSKKKDKLMCVNAYEYAPYSILTAYTLAKGKIHLYTTCQFKNWEPARDAEQFWGTDDCYYLPVIPSIVYDTHYNYSNKNAAIPGYNYRYIKITLKGPAMAPKELSEKPEFLADNHFNDQYNKLTETLTYEAQIRKTDSIRKQTSLQLKKLTKIKMTNALNGARFAYWKGKELRAVIWTYAGGGTKTRISYYFRDDQIICETNEVRIIKTGKIIYDEKYYFFNNGLFAWLEFNKRVAPYSKLFDIVRSNNPSEEIVNWPLKKP